MSDLAVVAAVLGVHGSQSAAVAEQACGAIGNLAVHANNSTLLGAAGVCESECSRGKTATQAGADNIIVFCDQSLHVPLLILCRVLS